MKTLTPTEKFEACMNFSKTCYMKGLCTKQEYDKACKTLKAEYIKEMIADFNESCREPRIEDDCPEWGLNRTNVQDFN
jgi:hypothetical protein